MIRTKDDEVNAQNQNTEILIGTLDGSTTVDESQIWLSNYLSADIEDDFRRRYFHMIKNTLKKSVGAGGRFIYYQR